MDKDRNRWGGIGNDESVLIDYLLVNYDVTPAEAKDAITVCGATDQGMIDDYMRSQGKQRKDNGNSSRQSE